MGALLIDSIDRLKSQPKEVIARAELCSCMYNHQLKRSTHSNTNVLISEKANLTKPSDAKPRVLSSSWSTIMIRQFVVTTLLVSSWCVADAAAPAEKGAYIGGAFGMTTLEDDGLFNGLTVDDSDSGFGIFGGYKFFKHLAVEGRYTDFGTFTVEGLGIDASVVSVHVVGIIPFADSGWELFGQLGLGTVDISIPGDSSSESVGSAGIGVRYSFSENLSLGVQTDAYAYEEVDFGTTYDIGVVQTAITIRLSF